jgi:hypothetical protein
VGQHKSNRFYPLSPFFKVPLATQHITLVWSWIEATIELLRNSQGGHDEGMGAGEKDKTAARPLAGLLILRCTLDQDRRARADGDDRAFSASRSRGASLELKDRARPVPAPELKGIKPPIAFPPTGDRSLTPGSFGRESSAAPIEPISEKKLSASESNSRYCSRSARKHSGEKLSVSATPDRR